MGRKKGAPRRTTTTDDALTIMSWFWPTDRLRDLALGDAKLIDETVDAVSTRLPGAAVSLALVALRDAVRSIMTDDDRAELAKLDAAAEAAQAAAQAATAAATAARSSRWDQIQLRLARTKVTW